MVEKVTNSLKDLEITYRGLSTDVKPINGVTNNDAFHELDTGAVYVYSERNINPITNNGWWEM